MSLEVNRVCLGELERVLRADVRSAPLTAWRNENSNRFNNESLDSGIAGIKDPGTGNNVLILGTEVESSSTEYIVDPSTRTTYLKGRFLGKGGFARVHELMDLTTNKVYAGKIIPKNRITKRHQMEKIAREILIHRSLIHDNVVRLHRFFENSVSAYIILENCSRKSLVHVLRHRHSLTEPEVRYYMMKVLLAVQYIHSQQVIHRDLKPGNMFLTELMEVKVGDFGLATQFDGDKRVTICGTPNYIAPEVLNKLSYSYEADVWALGCIMYALLVGQPPFETSTLKETYSRIVGNKYSIPYSTSESARSLITQLLSPKPQDRPKLREIFEHSFFTSGYMPDVLSPSCCYTAPKFPAFPGLSTSRPGILQTKLDDDKLNSLAHSVSTLRLRSSPSHESKNGAMPMPPIMEGSTSPAIVEGAAVVPVAPVPMPRSVSLKQKVSSLLCPDKIVLCRNGKRPCNAAALYDIVVNCLSSMPPSASGTVVANPPIVNSTPLFISKWIDYSNKYGFGFQLSDKAVGVLFNDNTRIGFTPDRSRVEFHDIHGKVSAHPQHSVPAPLHERLTLLRYFGRYMDEHLTEGGEVKPASARNKSTVPQMKRWVRTNTAIIMELNNGTLQINFFKDHTKVILSMGKQGHMVTYINCDRQSRSFWLQSIAEVGCEPSILERLRFAAAVLREFAELEATTT